MALRTYSLSTPLGEVKVLESDIGICCLDMGDAQGRMQNPSRFADWRRRHAPEETVAEAAANPSVVRQLNEYFAGKRQDFDLPLDLRGTPFQKRVWAALQRIPLGSVRTYGELARELGSPNGSRAVGGANGANPVPILVPCHRVVARTGLGGFSGPMAWKQGMLALEGACLDLSA